MCCIFIIPENFTHASGTQDNYCASASQMAYGTEMHYICQYYTCVCVVINLSGKKLDAWLKIACYRTWFDMGHNMYAGC